jgi:hypothetical protein
MHIDDLLSTHFANRICKMQRTAKYATDRIATNPFISNSLVDEYTPLK